MFMILIAYTLLLLFFAFLLKKHSRLNIYVTSLILITTFVYGFYYVMSIFDFNAIVIYLFFLIFFLFTFSFIVYLIWNSKRLIRREGNRITNLLSLGLAIIIITMILIAPTAFYINKTIASYIFVSYAFIIILFVYFFTLFFSCLLLSLIYSTPKKHNLKDINIILVLGSGLINNEVPPLLQHRINVGKSIYDLQNPKDSIFLMSGGQGEDEERPESIAMKEYLVKQGVPAKTIICETKSLNTYENLQFSKKIVNSLGLSSRKILLSTNNFHILRAVLIAKKLKYKNFQSIGSSTKSYFFTNAFIREFIAILKIDWWFHAVIVIIGCIWFLFTLFQLL
ncbi:YdcF family protein [Staphylococcus felis]|uniref:YdcF family protein n=1 Tax=Staphylococcus felis TaxID=46127 RepID=UPI000E21E683|nr:YdcF family protein [Staphylococcus felis]REI27569.1 YdcF family protein [Staphylococcus felis]